MESRLGASFSDVRVHTDGTAAALSSGVRADAFTIGTDIYFAAGRYAPDTSEGAKRLAHELVHVEQQRIGRRSGWHSGNRQAEREARRLAAGAAAGANVRVTLPAPHVIQRDGPGSDDATPPATAAPSATPQFQLDPDLQQLMLQQYIRWWLGSTLVNGSAPTSVPTAPDPNAAATPSIMPATPGAGILGLPSARLSAQLPLAPSFFSPLPPDPLFIQPDVGSLFSRFGERGAPVSQGDSQLVFDIYRRNEAIVRGMPDLRGMAPRFLRPLIPSTWRRDIAGALTGASVSAALKHDYPTPIEVSDQAWQRMTGVSTTVIPLPSISF